MKGDRAAISLWLWSRAGVALVVLAGSYQVGGRQVGAVPSFLASWDRWDVGLFRKVAEFGYSGYPRDYPDRGIEAFFPGFPLVLALVHRVVPDWVAAGLLVSLLAGAVGALWLARLAELDGVPGSRAVLYLVLSPYAVFLAAGYSEALFLALAVPGWWCARRGHWAAAGLLVAGSSAVRISGLFLAVGLLVHYAVTVRRVRPDAGWLLAPFAVLAGYSAYLHSLTGDWLRWQHAQSEGWERRLTAPWTALRTTVDAALVRDQGAAYAWSWRAEILAVLVGVAVVTVLLWRSRWGEAVYVGLSVGALASSTFYLSVARASLLWFPLWLLLAEAAQSRPWLHTAYVSLAAPLMAVGVLAFTSGSWVG
ncbi:MAG TPA: mannosyltransferase family protein [Mycobacteriales bacterium]|nr:mannosyltransferase family protein [Mycobacteriales bacterium]